MTNNFINVQNTSDTIDLSTILKELKHINEELRRQAENIAADDTENTMLISDQEALLDRQETLLSMALKLPITNENRPELLLELWQMDRFDPNDYSVAEALVVKVANHLAQATHA